MAELRREYTAGLQVNFKRYLAGIHGRIQSAHLSILDPYLNLIEGRVFSISNYNCTEGETQQLGGGTSDWCFSPRPGWRPLARPKCDETAERFGVHEVPHRSMADRKIVFSSCRPTTESVGAVPRTMTNPEGQSRLIKKAQRVRYRRTVFEATGRPSPVPTDEGLAGLAWPSPSRLS
jgi:hypothetical protein